MSDASVQLLVRDSELRNQIVDESPAMASPEPVLMSLVTVAEALEPALRMIMAHHLVVEGVGQMTLEGDGFLPRLANPAFLSLSLIHI